MFLEEYKNSGNDLFLILLGLFLTYFVFDTNKDILNQLKDLKIDITKLKTEPDFFKNMFLVRYIERKRRGAFINVFMLYVSLFASFFILIIPKIEIIFYFSFITFIALLFNNFSLENELLPICKALVQSNDLTSFLEQIDIKKDSNEFEEIFILYKKVSLSCKSEKEKEKLLFELLEKVP